MIKIGAFPLPLIEAAHTPNEANDSVKIAIGLVCKESSPVNITSLSAKLAMLVINLKVVPELPKSIGTSDELCNLPLVPITSK